MSAAADSTHTAYLNNLNVQSQLLTCRQQLQQRGSGAPGAVPVAAAGATGNPLAALSGEDLERFQQQVEYVSAVTGFEQVFANSVARINERTVELSASIADHIGPLLGTQADGQLFVRSPACVGLSTLVGGAWNWIAAVHRCVERHMDAAATYHQVRLERDYSTISCSAISVPSVHVPCAQFYHELYEVNEGLNAPWTLGASLPQVNVVKQLAVQSPAQLQPMRAQLEELLQSETLGGLLGAMREARTALTSTQMRIDSLKQRWRTVTPLHLREATATRAPGIGLDLVADVGPGSAAGSTRAGGSVNLSGSARHTSASHMAARSGPLTVRALTRFRSAQLSIEPGENLHLVDNSNKHTWKVL